MSPARSLATAVALFLAAAAPAAAQGWEPVVVGVREDARPFAYRDPRTGAFDGFIVDLCVQATVRAGRAPMLRAVSAAERAAILDGAETDIDLLCDATTVTLARIRAAASPDRATRFGFSPIVFLANGSYVANARAAPISEPPGGGDCLLARPEVSEGRDAEPAEGPPAAYGAAYLRGATTGETLRRAIRGREVEVSAPELVCPVAQETNLDAVAAFCSGELKYWFADADILRATIASWTSETGRDCPHAFGRSLSYEPYALLVSSRLPGFRDDFTAGLYELFGKGVALRLLDIHFDTSRGVSPTLETLFRINSVPTGLSFWPGPSDPATGDSMTDDPPPEADPAEGAALVPTR